MTLGIQTEVLTENTKHEHFEYSALLREIELYHLIKATLPSLLFSLH